MSLQDDIHFKFSELTGYIDARKDRFTRDELGPYLIIVTDATDAVSVNFSGLCKFLLI